MQIRVQTPKHKGFAPPPEKDATFDKQSSFNEASRQHFLEIKPPSHQTSIMNTGLYNVLFSLY